MLSGLSLPQILLIEARQNMGSSYKSVIMVYLPGRPPHLDVYDLKPDAPVETRGEFNPVKTNVSGIEICKLMPHMAQIIDKVSIVRSLVGAPHGHTSIPCLTERLIGPLPAGGWPSLGSVQRMDMLSQQAFRILTSSRLTETLNFTRENPRVIERYGRGVPKL